MRSSPAPAPAPTSAAGTARVVSARDQAERIADRLPPLLVAAERVAMTIAQGVHGRRRVGVGETFWQFRPYQQGDSSARIDWRQSARASQLFLRDQEWEASESVWLWIDGSDSMNYRSATSWPTKMDRGVLLALALASLLIRAGERVALLGGGGRPAGGRTGMARFCEGLAARTEPAENLPAKEALPRHARIILLSDFFTPLDELRARLRAMLAMGVRGHLLQVIDPAEEGLPFSGRVRFEDVELAGSSTLIGNVDSIRDRYRRRFEAHHEGLRDLARGQGWTFATHRIDRPPEPALLGLYTALSTKGLG